MDTQSVYDISSDLPADIMAADYMEHGCTGVVAEGELARTRCSANE